MNASTAAPRFQSRRLIIFASMALYAVALFAPALSYHVIASCTPGDTSCLTSPPYPHRDEGLESSSGMDMLLSGILFAPFEGIFAAYANPLLWLGWIFLLRRKNRIALYCLLPACLLSLQSFELYRVHWPLDEGVVKRALLSHFQFGFFFWLVSLLLPATAACCWYLVQRRADSAVSPDSPN